MSNNEALNLINQARTQAQRDRLKQIFSGKAIFGLVILLIVGGLGFFAFKVYRDFRVAKYSEIFHQSLIEQQLGEFSKAKENLKKIYEAKTAPSGVRSLAAIRYAAFLLDEGNREEAIKIYLDINDCSSCDDYTSDLAGLLAVRLWVADENEVQKDDLVSRIEKIENRSKGLKNMILEQLAILEMKKGNLEKSYEIFDKISKSSEASEALKSRSADGLAMIISKGYQPKTDAKAEALEEEKSEKKSAK